jgi:CubicO group peptidase (beta-lactamase class C family)
LNQPKEEDAMSIGRRIFLGQVTAAAIVALRAPPAFAGPESEPEPSPDQAQRMRVGVLDFMERYGVPGMAVAISRHGQVVYEQAFGFADKGRAERLSPTHLFRIASVTKPITSVALFTLIEQGHLALGDFVFRRGGVLHGDFDVPRSPYLEELRIEHLLTHTGGGWPNDGTDPMFRNPQMNHHELIQWTLNHLPIQYPPGEHYAYSNFGYCLLGRIIEKVARRPYFDYVRTEVLERCNVRSMRLAGNTLKGRPADEVVYDGQGEDPYIVNVRRMDSHGGWLARASDLVRFAIHVDGFSTERNILKPETIELMTTPTVANPGYAKGWQVNPRGNWWHGGSLPGTTSLLVRTSSGLCWAALTNTRRKGMDGDLDRLIWQVVGQVPQWHA